MAVSETALATLAEFRAGGLVPTDRDVIRLNALGLKLEAATKKHAVSTVEYLPRVAQIGTDVVFRQPSIGHEIWLDKVDQLTLEGDVDTVLAVRAYALSRDADKLCDPLSPADIRQAVGAFVETVAGFTRDQIYAAIDYVIYGASPLRGERPAPIVRPRDDASDEIEDYEQALVDGEDWRECVAVGVLADGRAALFGLTAAEMSRMTREQLNDQIRLAIYYHDLRGSYSPDVEWHRNNYYATVAEIRARLTKERES